MRGDRATNANTDQGMSNGPARKVMMLTGCASGIGRHLAGVLARQGHSLLLTDINEQGLKETLGRLPVASPGQQVLAQRLDVRDAGRWRELVELSISTWGRLDVLLNIAGYLLPGLIHETAPEQIDLHLDINTKGVIHGTRAAAIQMVKQGHGHIVNIASLAGLAPVPGLCLYSASKFAVRGFSLAVAQELAPHNVSFTVICPDAVRTPMLDLQVDYREAALTFSGDEVLTVEDIEGALKEVFVRRPLEVVLPRGRGLLARMASLAPRLAARLLPLLTRKGLSRQAAARSHRDGR